MNPKTHHCVEDDNISQQKIEPITQELKTLGITIPVNNLLKKPIFNSTKERFYDDMKSYLSYHSSSSEQDESLPTTYQEAIQEKIEQLQQQAQPESKQSRASKSKPVFIA